MVLPNSLQFVTPLKLCRFTTILYFRFAYIGRHVDSWPIRAATTKTCNYCYAKICDSQILDPSRVHIFPCFLPASNIPSLRTVVPLFGINNLRRRIIDFEPAPPFFVDSINYAVFFLDRIFAQ